MNTISKRPLLSILIPTFNRAECLDLNLKHLTSQVTDDLLSKIEVIVSDNCSQDNTKEILKKYERYSYIKTNFNTANIGMDLNFLKLVQESTGKYCWIFGDDEVLFKDGLQKVVSLIEKHPDLGLIHIKPHGHDAISSFDAEKIVAESPTVQLFQNPQIFLKGVSFNISFITSHIFNRTCLDSGQVSNDHFVGSYLNQISFYLQAALGAKTNLILMDTVFSQLNNNTGGYKLFEVFGSNQQKIFHFYRKFGLEDSTIHKINQDLLKSFFPSFILLAGSSKKSSFQAEPAFTILFKNFKKFPEFWLFCMPILLIPTNLRWNLYQIVRKLKRLRFRNTSVMRAN